MARTFKTFLEEMTGGGTGMGDVAPFARNTFNSPVQRTWPSNIATSDVKPSTYESQIKTKKKVKK